MAGIRWWHQVLNDPFALTFLNFTWMCWSGSCLCSGITCNSSCLDFLIHSVITIYRPRILYWTIFFLKAKFVCTLYWLCLNLSKVSLNLGSNNATGTDRCWSNLKESCRISSLKCEGPNYVLFAFSSSGNGWISGIENALSVMLLKKYPLHP